MEVYDLLGRSDVHDAAALFARLRSGRQGPHGAFILAHAAAGPSLWMHFNGDVAHAHYFPDHPPTSAGFQPTGMTPTGCDGPVRFVQTDGTDGGGFDMDPSAVCPADAAFLAAAEFLADPGRPTAIQWTEL